MLPLLLLSFIVVPIVELAVIARVGDVLGFWPTLLILIADSLVGAVLVRKEGRRAWQRFRSAVTELRWPGDEVVQGALVLVGGALLLTPGFVTDVVGLLAVIPPTRAILSRLVRSRVRSLAGDRVGVTERSRPDRGGGEAYDVEVVSVERDRPRPGTGRDTPAEVTDADAPDADASDAYVPDADQPDVHDRDADDPDADDRPEPGR